MYPSLKGVRLLIQSLESSEIAFTFYASFLAGSESLESMDFCRFIAVLSLLLVCVASIGIDGHWLSSPPPTYTYVVAACFLIYVGVRFYADATFADMLLAATSGCVLLRYRGVSGFAG